jgi:phosphoribosyl-AMP cyclohydrolase
MRLHGGSVWWSAWDAEDGDRSVRGIGFWDRTGDPYPAGMPLGSRIDASPEQLASVTFNSDGLVAAIAQDVATGEVLMMAWMNAESLARTFDEGRMVYWSRSRQELWRKGDTSGDRQYVREAYYDCDGDALLFRVEQEGAGACHTGARTCFFRKFGP